MFFSLPFSLLAPPPRPLFSLAATMVVTTGGGEEGDGTDEPVNTTGTMIMKSPAAAADEEAALGAHGGREDSAGLPEEMCLANTAGTMIIKPGAGAAVDVEGAAVAGVAAGEGEGPQEGGDEAVLPESQGGPMLGAGVGAEKSSSSRIRLGMQPHARALAEKGGVEDGGRGAPPLQRARAASVAGAPPASSSSLPA